MHIQIAYTLYISSDIIFQNVTKRGYNDLFTLHFYI